MSDLNSLFENVRREQDEIRSAAGHVDKLEQTLSRVPVKPRNSGRWLAVAGLSAAMLVAVVVAVWMRPERLEVRVAGSTDRVPTGVWLGSAEDRKLPLEFSDGTRVELGAESEARIVNLSASSARMELKRGHAHFEVTPRSDASFSVQAGPYVVRVKGTRFEVTWQPVEDAFVVTLHEGRVMLFGCGFGDAGRELAAGQTARARCKTPDVSIDYGEPVEARAPKAPPAVPESEPSQGPSKDEAKTAEERAAKRTVQTSPESAEAGSEAFDRANWKKLAKQGAYRDALAAVEAGGFDAEAGRASAAELMMLADAAQHAGRPARAKSALVLVRQRFGSSEEARLAAFALGRLEFDAFGAHARAARWFRTYLKEQPGGPFAREALGRLMEAVQRTGDRAEARRLAQRYMSRYPSGPHAELASRLANAH